MDGVTQQNAGSDSIVAKQGDMVSPSSIFGHGDVVTFAAFGIVLDQTIGSGNFIFASVRKTRSHLKALAVYSVDCRANANLTDTASG